jgi:hypothetical protein
MRGIRSKTLMHAYDKDTGVLDQNKQGELGYKIIGPIRNSGITFDYGRKRWKFNSRTHASFLCPLVYENSLTDLFVEYANRTPENLELLMALMDNSPDADFSISLCKGMTFLADKDSGLKDFRVYGTTSYGTQAYGKNGIHCRARPRFDGVEVKLATDHGDEIKICQVVTYYYILTYICGIYTLIYPNILIYASRF